MPITILASSSILDVWQGKYAFENVRLVTVYIYNNQAFCPNRRWIWYKFEDIGWTYLCLEPAINA